MLFEGEGLLRGIGTDYWAWDRKDFHPDQIDDRRMIEGSTAALAADFIR